VEEFRERERRGEVVEAQMASKSGGPEGSTEGEQDKRIPKRELRKAGSPAVKMGNGAAQGREAMQSSDIETPPAAGRRAPKVPSRNEADDWENERGEGKRWGVGFTIRPGNFI